MKQPCIIFMTMGLLLRGSLRCASCWLYDNARTFTSFPANHDEDRQLLRRTKAAQCLQGRGRVSAGWALSQGIAQVFPVFDIPNWLIRLIVLLIIIGLPIALVLASTEDLVAIYRGIHGDETAREAALALVGRHPIDETVGTMLLWRTGAIFGPFRAKR